MKINVCARAPYLRPGWVKKGLRYLIEAIPDAIEKHPGAHLTIAGLGPEEPALRRQAESLACQKIKFLGAVPQEELPGLYRRAGVFVAPFVEAAGGDQEGLGLLTVEAVGCGWEVVVSDLPAAGDVIGELRMKTPPADTATLAARILEMLQMPAEDRQRLANRAGRSFH